MKRAIDVALALILLALLAPMFLLIATLLRVALGRPVLLAEHHIGFADEVFTAYTFHTSSIQRVRNLASDGTIATIAWEHEEAACLASLRDSKLDRLPQLLSILRGDMSFVGPRPVSLDELDHRGHCTPDYLVARPGLVGLRGTDRSGRFGYRGRAALDRHYVRRWSVWLDLVLLANGVVGVRDGSMT